jgi:CheY-like chemotaxis protein
VQEQLPKDCLSGRRVLLAEDAPDNQRLIRFILEKAGAEVAIADNGRIALDEIRDAGRRGEPFDIIVTDIQMPVFDGYELTKRLRQDDYRGSIVALTANAMEGEQQKCLAIGCDDYLSKPIDRAKLLSMVARHSAEAFRRRRCAGNR